MEADLLIRLKPIIDAIKSIGTHRLVDVYSTDDVYVNLFSYAFWSANSSSGFDFAAPTGFQCSLAILKPRAF
jgi:hypothetical protein